MKFFNYGNQNQWCVTLIWLAALSSLISVCDVLWITDLKFLILLNSIVALMVENCWSRVLQNCFIGWHFYGTEE